MTLPFRLNCMNSLIFHITLLEHHLPLKVVSFILSFCVGVKFGLKQWEWMFEMCFENKMSRMRESSVFSLRPQRRLLWSSKEISIPINSHNDRVYIFSGQNNMVLCIKWVCEKNNSNSSQEDVDNEVREGFMRKQQHEHKIRYQSSRDEEG